MSMSGIDVSAETKATFNDMKLKRTHELLVMEIVNKKVIEVNSELSKEKCSNEEFYKFLKENQETPFFIVYDFKVTEYGGGKLILVSWVPDNSNVIKKMIYASTKDAIKSKFEGIKVNVQASGLDDIDMEDIKTKAKSA